LGAHMLEVCPSIASNKPKLEVLPLSIGGKNDPARLIFDSNIGPAVAASLVDLGNRFRLIVSQVDVVPTEQPLPKLPVARALWTPQPDLKRAAAAWIYAGGAHHTSFSFALTQDYLRDYAEMAGIEYVAIDNSLDLNQFKQQLKWNDLYYHLAKGI
ncbi:MAG: L-arabinose isomerase, partial [Leptolinea sp.]|nr:L-arabinose isomerase [Leptolinea sp.]